MKRIARKLGAPEDASRDYDYTNWRDLDAFTAECLQSWIQEEVTAPEVR
jgi:hypothetical protein